MKLLMNVVTTLKQMYKNMFLTAASFLLLPVLLAAFMGFIADSTGGENPLKYKKVDVAVEDLDNSELSKKLIDFLKSDELGELIEVKDKADKVITIPSGYENSLLKGEKNNISITEDDESKVITGLKSVLDKYHKAMYSYIKTGSSTELNKVFTSEVIENESVQYTKTTDSYGKTAVSMISFVIGMLLFGIIQGSFTPVSKNLDKRIMSTPLTKCQLYCYNSAAYFVYASIILFIYTMFFRLLNIAFLGNLSGILAIIFVGALFLTCISMAIVGLLGEKLAKVIGFALFLLPMIAQTMFSSKTNMLTAIDPTHYVTESFTLYNMEGTLSSSFDNLFLLIIISVIAFTVTMIKLRYFKEVKKWA